MRQAELSLMHSQAVIDLPAVRADCAVNGPAQQGIQTFRTATSMNDESAGLPGGRRPQPALLAGLFPACLVHLLDRGLAYGGQGLAVRWRQGGDGFLFASADAAPRDGNGEGCL